MTIKPHENTIKLVEFIKSKHPGDKISFLEIEEKTGVMMDTQGKTYLRTALKMTRTPSLSIRKYGIRLVSPDTSREAVDQQLCKVSNSTKRARKVTYNISDKFLDDMDESSRNHVMKAVSIFGMIEAHADEFKAMQKLDKYRLKQITGGTRPDPSSYK